MSPSQLTNGKVLVIDSDGIYLAPTNPANARKLMGSGQAKVKTFNPFTIILLKQVPSPNIKRRIKIMRLPNLHQFFAEPKPIYVQNISNPIGVISLEFRSPNGEVYSYRVPANRNPIVLTNIIPFDAVKSSALFLSFLQKTPQGTGPHLQLLSEEEFNSYYSDKQAEIEANSVEELINEAQEKAAQFNDPSHKIVSEEEARPNQPIREGALGPEVSTRVIAVCQQLDPSNTNKVDAREAIDTFASLELTTIDYDYILKNCFDEVNKANGIVRKWAFARMKEVMGKMEDGIIRSEAAEKRTRLAK